MKVAFFVYPSAFQSPGGGEILLLKTKEALEKKGITIRLFNQWEDKLKDFDILHVFGSFRDCVWLMRTARSLGVKIVLSPIFWSTLQRTFFEYGSFYQRTQMVLKHMAKVALPFLPSERRNMFLLADTIVPNSHAEAEQVSRLFCIKKNKMHVVYLAADEKFMDSDGSEFTRKYKIKDFILSVGRIEPRKNQLNLIRALKGSGSRLVFIGDVVPHYEEYYNRCKNEADKETLFINRMEHDDTLLSSAYAACDVFVLQSWFETPGLAALEAALSGARLAMTRGGSTREYFKDYVEYLNPASPGSIREAVDRALQREKTNVLKQHVMNNYLWSHSADENIRVYEKLLQ